MSECNHNCASCSSDCDSRIEVLQPTPDSKIKKVVGVLSGKGGVGKSMVSSLLAVELAKKGYSVGIMDADITGPSIQKIFNASNELYGDEEGIYPYETALGIRLVSINMMLATAETPVLWRGPVVAGAVRQFFSEVHWGDLDVLLIDMPPGTGDVALSVLQEIPVDGLVMVTSPSKLVSMVVAKAINMANTADKNVYGLVENMSYIKCDECGHEIRLYKGDDTERVAEEYGLDILAKMPIDPELSSLSDEGEIEVYDGHYLEGVIERIL